MLLIIRDLMIGPRRFKDLLDGLPGIGTNLLATRLRFLQDQEIIEKETDIDQKLTAYVLTEKGRALEPVVLSMARWSLFYLQEESQGKLNRPELLVVAFRAAFQADKSHGVHVTYEFRIGGVVFYTRIEDGKLCTGLGTATHPAFVYITDEQTFNQIVRGGIDEQVARNKGQLDILGDQDAYHRFLTMFGG